MWANGEVWTDYSLVVLLRLRDENVQEAVELVDINVKILTCSYYYP